MHFIKSILLGISSLLIVGTPYAAEVSMEKVDSIYQHMSPGERLSQLVLVKSTADKLQLNDKFGGVLYTEPLEYPRAHPGQLVAVQLDRRLNPLTATLTNLPGLYTLASLSSEELLEQYLEYLVNEVKGQGIDLLILPDVEDTLSRTGRLVKQINAYDPQFFLLKADLSFEKARRRKMLVRLFEENQFWVIDSGLEDFASRKIERHSQRIFEEVTIISRIKQKILFQYQNVDRAPRKLPNQLAVAISKGSVIPLQKEPDIFPLEKDTICFLTNQPFGAMANMIRKYGYVMTAYEEIVNSDAPIIIDNSAFVPPGILADTRKVIFVGELDHVQHHLAHLDGALVYSSPSEIYTYVIPQQLFGATEASGKLPLRSSVFDVFENDPVTGFGMLGYAPAAMAGLDQNARRRIEEVLEEAIQTGSTPGGQLAIAVDGAIILDEAYGHLTYDSLIPSERSTLYDLASVTKVAGTLLAVMKLYEEGELNLDAGIGQYLPAYQNSNKENITIRALLSHNGGLRPYVPFWQRVLTADLLETFYYEDLAAELEDRRSYGIRPNTNLKDTLNNWIIQSSLISYDSLPPYSYSDIGFMILHQVVEAVSDQPMDQYLSRHFYQPMGLKRLTFNPMDQGFQRFEIAPTEHDAYFRDELVWGQVHDRNAVVFGGVAGHAGLFANAHELAVILQTILQGGSYGGHQLLQPNTINYFNQKFFPENRRALGWDKKDDLLGNASMFCTDESFGHTGFTGTMVWADPQYDLVFVFLSNRIHPNANNYQLNLRNIRTRIQDVVYEALMAKWIK